MSKAKLFSLLFIWHIYSQNLIVLAEEAEEKNYARWKDYNGKYLRRFIKEFLKESLTISMDSTYGGYVTAALKMDGTEISSEDLPFIFNKFYQADKSHASAGNGIGLALAKRIVSLHGGEITAESEKGKTVFTVILPAE